MTEGLEGRVLLTGFDFPGRQYDVGFEPSSVVSADLDGDGDIDLATANNSSGNISVLRNNGDETHAARVDYPAGGGQFFLMAADLDSDSDIDLATANGNGNWELRTAQRESPRRGWEFQSVGCVKRTSLVRDIYTVHFIHPCILLDV
jgi:hypothetical protein